MATSQCLHIHCLCIIYLQYIRYRWYQSNMPFDRSNVMHKLLWFVQLYTGWIRLAYLTFNCYSIERRTALQNTLENQPVIFLVFLPISLEKHIIKKWATKFKLLINMGVTIIFPNLGSMTQLWILKLTFTIVITTAVIFGASLFAFLGLLIFRS